VTVPPFSGEVDVFCMVRLTATFVSPTTTTEGYVGVAPTPMPAQARDASRVLSSATTTHLSETATALRA
jgi:hypothetical protein